MLAKDGLKISFEKELASLINKFGLDNLSNTPDYILADYLMDCFEIFHNTMNERDEWYNESKMGENYRHIRTKS
jgi:hypothetical protein